MKKLILSLIIIFALSFAQQAQAQELDLAKIQKPDFPFEPMYLDSSYQMTSLPDERYETIILNGKFFYNFNAPNSKFRHNSKPLYLVVNQGLVNGTEASVKDTYKLYKTEVKKNKRSFLWSVSKASGTSTAEDLPIEYKKINDGLWLLTIKNIEPGEYIIVVATPPTGKYYSFGIQ